MPVYLDDQQPLLAGLGPEGEKVNLTNSHKDLLKVLNSRKQ